MNRLSDVLLDVFKGYSHDRGVHRRNSLVLEKKIMEIPINKDSFELPTFAIEPIIKKNIDLNSVDKLVIALYSKGGIPAYKTVARYMQDVLVSRYSSNELIVLKTPDGNTGATYYAANGAIFDKDITPIMMCSWLIGRVEHTTETKYMPIKPIIRISPKVFLSQSNAIEKFVVKKILYEALEIRNNNINIYYPIEHLQAGHNLPLQVVIEESPFLIRKTNTPSVGVSDSQLLQIATNHLDEIMSDWYSVFPMRRTLR